MADVIPVNMVIAAATSQGLVSLTTAKDELGIPAADTSQDGILGRQIAQVSVAINNFCGRIFVKQTYRDTFTLPYSCLAQGQPLQLRQYPVIMTGTGANAVTTLTVAVDGNTLSPSEWMVNNQTGAVYRLISGAIGGWTGSVVVCNYQAGYASIPEDLQGAALEWLTARWSSRGRDPLLRSQTIPDVVAETYWVDPGSSSESSGVPAEVRDILCAYLPMWV